MRPIEPETERLRERLSPEAGHREKRPSRESAVETRLAQWLFYACALVLCVILAVILTAAIGEFRS